jgi:hypothetical protein
MIMKRICVFCGSNLGLQPEYVQAARALGSALVRRGVELVYGGGSGGLMGEIARTVLAEGGQVIGVVPKALFADDQVFSTLANLRIVSSMHERKALMAELSDGFIALPGGLGTLEELMEVLTWAQIGIHRKPCGLLNVNQYYSKLIDFLDYAVSEQFIRPAHRSRILVADNPDDLLEHFNRHLFSEAPAP